MQDNIRQGFYGHLFSLASSNQEREKEGGREGGREVGREGGRERRKDDGIVGVFGQVPS
jgi:hypothetical protein